MLAQVLEENTRVSHLQNHFTGYFSPPGSLNAQRQICHRQAAVCRLCNRSSELQNDDVYMHGRRHLLWSHAVRHLYWSAFVKGPYECKANCVFLYQLSKCSELGIGFCMSCSRLYIIIYVITARGSDGSIVFSIVAKFFSVNTTHEPLHLAWWNFPEHVLWQPLEAYWPDGHRSKVKVT